MPPRVTSKAILLACLASTTFARFRFHHVYRDEFDRTATMASPSQNWGHKTLMSPPASGEIPWPDYSTEEYPWYGVYGSTDVVPTPSDMPGPDETRGPDIPTDKMPEPPDVTPTAPPGETPMPTTGLSTSCPRLFQPTIFDLDIQPNGKPTVQQSPDNSLNIINEGAGRPIRQQILRFPAVPSGSQCRVGWTLPAGALFQVSGDNVVLFSKLTPDFEIKPGEQEADITAKLDGAGPQKIDDVGFKREIGSAGIVVGPATDVSEKWFDCSAGEEVKVRAWLGDQPGPTGTDTTTTVDFKMEAQSGVFVEVKC